MTTTLPDQAGENTGTEQSTARQSLIAVIPQYFVAVFALLYASGFLVMMAFHDRFGIRESATELWRARYIHIGIVTLALPVILIGTAFASRYISRHPRADLSLPQMKQRTLPIVLLLINFEFVVFVMITFTRGGQPGSPALGFTPLQWILGVIIIGMTLVLLVERITVTFVNGFAKDEKKDQALAFPHQLQIVLRWLLVAIVFGLDVWFALDFRGKLGGISFSIVFLYIFVGVTVGLLAGVLSAYVKRQTDRGNRAALWAIGACLLPPLYYVMLLAFAYGVFPFMPAARGGGDYTGSPKVVVQFKSKDMPSVPPPYVSSTDPSRTRPLIMLEENAIGIYTADPADAGGPEEWRSLGGRKPKLVFFTHDVIANLEFESRSASQKPVKP